MIARSVAESFFSLRKTKQKPNKQKQMNFCLSGKIGANKEQHLQESSEPDFLQRCVIFNHCPMNIERLINTSAFTNCVIIRLIIVEINLITVWRKETYNNEINFLSTM